MLLTKSIYFLCINQTSLSSIENAVIRMGRKLDVFVIQRLVETVIEFGLAIYGCFQFNYVVSIGTVSQNKVKSTKIGSNFLSDYPGKIKL